jgi:hypothetical protein
MDSFGANAGLFKPITWPTQDAPGKIEPFYGVPELNSATQGCVLDRVPIPCDMLANLKEAGGIVSESLVKDDDGFWRFYRESFESHGLGLFTTKPYQVVELGNGLKPPKPVDLAVLQNSIDTCVTELWPWFDMTSIKFTDAPGKDTKNDKYNGVTTLRDVEFDKTFQVTNDPTPPADVQADITNHDARGRSDSANPFWNYAYPQGSAATRPGERRYPELLGHPSMLYIRVQIHELGASLSAIRDIYHPVIPGKPVLNDRGLDPGHGDDGPALEDCVGRNYYTQMGLTPKSKP